MALSGEEREAHAPSNEEGVDLFEQGFDHAELVGDLGPPEHGDEGPLGFGQ